RPGARTAAPPPDRRQVGPGEVDHVDLGRANGALDPGHDGAADPRLPDGGRLADHVDRGAVRHVVDVDQALRGPGCERGIDDPRPADVVEPVVGALAGVVAYPNRRAIT